MITIEDIKIYEKVKTELDVLCKEWAKNNLETWEHYSGYTINLTDNTITIGYTYQDFWSNTEYCTEYDSVKVPILEIICEYK
jgi:hypothetical protein